MILPVAFGQVFLNTAQIAKRVSPSVVVIEGETDSGAVLGSGFIVSKDGKIVTNLHVISDLKAVRVYAASGEIFDRVSVVATDERRDLAIVQVAGFDLAAQSQRLQRNRTAARKRVKQARRRPAVAVEDAASRACK